MSYKCEKCGKGYKLEYNLEKHNTDFPNCNTDSTCNKHFTRTDNYQRHIQTYSDKSCLKETQCQKCHKNFSSPSKLRIHNNNKNDCSIIVTITTSTSNEFSCEHCNRSFSSSLTLSKHKKHSCKVIKINKINEDHEHLINTIMKCKEACIDPSKGNPVELLDELVEMMRKNI
jgi:C2H2 type zinc finger protein